MPIVRATKVKAINFIGNRAFSDSQLRDIITTTQSSLFDFIKGTNIYDPDRLSLDRELLRQYYLRNGYADARIVSAGAELDRDGSGFYITFVIDEGEDVTTDMQETDVAGLGHMTGALREGDRACKRILIDDLRGQVEIYLRGVISSKHGGLKTVFNNVPDVPVSRFALKMKGGKKSLLVNSTNTCAKPQRAKLNIKGQNGKKVKNNKFKLNIASCKHHKKHKK